eukprot:680711-Prorocentrum_minimum.AAC.3
MAESDERAAKFHVIAEPPKWAFRDSFVDQRLRACYYKTYQSCVTDLYVSKSREFDEERVDLFRSLVASATLYSQLFTHSK